MAFGDGLSEGFDWEAVSSYVEFRQTVEERFPSFAWALDHPELGPLIQRAAGEEEWSPQLFQSQLEETEWWTSRTQAQREYDIWWEKTPEQEKVRRIEEAQGQLIDLKSRLGVELSPQEMYDLTVAWLRNGWNEDELTGQIVSTSSGRGLGTGSIQGDIEYVKAKAARNYVTVSDAKARELAERIARGEMTQADLDLHVKALAQATFTDEASKNALELGLDMYDVLGPQRNVISSMLGLSDVQVDLMNDQRFQSVLSGGAGGGAMTMAETASYIRGMDEYWQMEGGEGQQKMYGLVNSLRRAMGASR